MRILWFTNTSSNAPLKNKNVRGGWISSLENEISKNENIELGVVFMHHESFFHKNGNVSYYGIKQKFSNKFLRFFQRYLKLLPDTINADKLDIIIKKFNPDLIHIHGTESDFCQLLVKDDIPSVVSIQGNMTIYTHKFFSGFSKLSLLRIVTFTEYFFKTDIFTQYSFFKKKSIREIEYLKSAKNVIGRTDWDRNIMRVLAPNANYYLGNEILRSQFYNSVWSKNQKQDKFKIVSVIGSNIFKGLETILHSVKLLNELNFDFEWNIIGIDKTDLIYRSSIKESGLNFKTKNLNILGNLDVNELIKQLLKSSLYVSVSHIENSPNNICEAMILGMPIISSFAGGSSSIMTHKKEGILIQDGDPWNLSGNIINIFENYDLALDMGRNARKKALNRHLNKNVSKEYIDIYKKLISEK